MARVLVTGASGFIGSKLAARLSEQGDEVHCLVRRSSNTSQLAPLGVKFRTGDLGDVTSLRAAVAGVDVVYHLAGLTKSLRAEDLMAVNAQGMANVLAACTARETPPVVLAVSSLAAAGPSNEGHPRCECDRPAPVSNYGRSKRAGEVVAESYAGRIPITIIRPPIVFGPGDHAMCPLFRAIHRHGLHMALGVARMRYSMIHVSDLVEAMIACAQRGARLIDPAARPDNASPIGDNPIGQGYYFAAANETPSFGELGPMIGRTLGIDRVRIVGGNRVGVLWSAAAVAETVAHVCRRPFIFNLDKVREARAGDWTCSTETIRRDVGFTVTSPLTERLRETSQWYREQRWI